MELREALHFLSKYQSLEFEHVNHLIHHSSPLYCAFLVHRLDLVALLVENGADINLPLLEYYHDWSCMYAVEAAGSVEAIRLGIQYGACHDSLCWLLARRARCNDRRSCLLLIDAGANVDGGYIDIDYGKFMDVSHRRFVACLLKERAALKSKIVALLAARKRSPLLQRCGRDVVTLIAKVAWNERPRE